MSLVHCVLIVSFDSFAAQNEGLVVVVVFGSGRMLSVINVLKEPSLFLVLRLLGGVLFFLLLLSVKTFTGKTVLTGKSFITGKTFTDKTITVKTFTLVVKASDIFLPSYSSCRLRLRGGMLFFVMMIVKGAHIRIMSLVTRYW